MKWDKYVSIDSEKSFCIKPSLCIVILLDAWLESSRYVHAAQIIIPLQILSFHHDSVSQAKKKIPKNAFIWVYKPHSTNVATEPKICDVILSILDLLGLCSFSKKRAALTTIPEALWRIIGDIFLV